MIINHRYKFIYIKTYKTASTSIETALTRICSDSDVITEAHKDFRAHRYRQAQNYRLDHPAVPKRPFWKTLLGRPERHYHQSVGFYEHMPAWRVKSYIDASVWNSYFKFSFERNPWDRQLSFYQFKTKSQPVESKQSFLEFLSNKKRAYIENWSLYTIDDQIALDFVGKFEELEVGFEFVKKSVGAPKELVLPKINCSKDQRLYYRDFYDENSRVIVHNWYRREINYFGYEF